MPARDSLVWAVGTFVNLSTDNNQTPVLQGQNNALHVVDAPNPGYGTNILGGAAAIGDSVWAVGQFDDGGSRQPFVERHQLP